jgi:hypothetical protein
MQPQSIRKHRLKIYAFRVDRKVRCTRRWSANSDASRNNTTITLFYRYTTIRADPGCRNSRLIYFT